MKKNYIQAEEFDQKFDDGEDIREFLDLDNSEHSGTKNHRVNVVFPTWMIQSPVREVRKLVVTRQSIIKI